MTQGVRWNLQGDYFENCNCDVVCPCLVSPGGPFTAMPTEGYCDVGLAFHVDRGMFGDVRLDGLNIIAVAHADGVMGTGNWTMGIYIDSAADEPQREALQTIFSGTVGGPMAIMAPLIGKVVGAKSVPITFTKDGKRRSVEVPNILHMAVQGIPSMKPDGSEVWASTGHPVSPDKLALAFGEQGSTYRDDDFDMHWDNSGKNGHYAEIAWTNG